MDPKLKALVDNQIAQLKSGGRTDFSEMLGIRWEPAPKGFQCPMCNGGMERTRGLMLTSPWVGGVRCTACEYKNSVCGYLAQSMFRVEPLQTGGRRCTSTWSPVSSEPSSPKSDPTATSR